MRTRRLIALSALLCACAAEEKKAAVPPPPTCTDPAASAVGAAVANYVKLVEPTPMRFLVASGTDSALPEPGLRALQDKGPTFLYPASPALQQQIRTSLAEKGDWPTLLVVYRGARAAGNTATVRLGGHFVGGKTGGKTVPSRVLNFVCDSTGWRFTTATEEKVT